MKIKLLAFSFLVSAFAALHAQLPVHTIPLPMESPKAVTKQTIGITTIEIEYSRPAVKGREIWGKLVAYNNGVPYPWRAGANENTTISFSTNAKVEGMEIPAGKYGLHMIPGPDSCTVMFSKNTSIWGSFSYRQSEDMLRIKVPNKTSPMQELLVYGFDNLTDSSAEVALSWEKRKIPFTIEVDTKKHMLEMVRNLLRSTTGFSWEGWHSAAEYCLLNNYNLTEALGWVQRSMVFDDNFVNNKTRSEILRKLGRDLQADSAWQKALAIGSYSDLSRHLSITNAGQKWNQGVDIFQVIEKKYQLSFGNLYLGGRAYRNLKDAQKATDCLNKALALAVRQEDKKRVADELKLLN